jgi:hypothetical protein
VPNLAKKYLFYLKTMKTAFYLLLGVLAANTHVFGQFNYAGSTVTSGQVTTLTELNGLEIQGHPFLNENFVEGTLSINHEKPLALLLRFNTFTGNIEYKNDKGIVYFVSSNKDLFEANFGDQQFRNGFKPIDELQAKSVFMVVYDGKTKLLKYTKGILTDVNTYNEAAKIKKFDTVETHYVEKDGQMIKIKRNKENIVLA